MNEKERIENLSTEEFEKERGLAVVEVARLLNAYKLTIIVEHDIKIVPAERFGKGA